MAVTLLGPGDEAALEAFLRAHADTSMFLRSNAARAGLVDRGEPRQATYVAARDAADAITAVAAHCWNGMVLVQGEIGPLADAVRDAVARCGRSVAGLSGPYAQVVAARAALGMAERATRMEEREDLFVLDLADLVVPRALADGTVTCRPPRASEVPLLARWMYEYEVEALGLAPSAEREAELARTFEPGEARRVLVAGDTLVAMTTFNAQLPDTVQVGGVYTPPGQRGRGYARAVVAGSLLDARARGVQRSILFTGAANTPARTAYLALGYRITGDYGLVLFA